MAQLFSKHSKRGLLVLAKIALIINLSFTEGSTFASTIPEINVKDFEVNVGIDLNIDLNIEINFNFHSFSGNNLFDPSIFTKIGIIAQIGNYNEAILNQIGQMNYGIIYQYGSFNIANQFQNGEHNSAIIYQKGINNYAVQEQNGLNNLAVIIQIGVGNYAEQYQMSSSGVRSIIKQEGNFNYARIYQH